MVGASLPGGSNAFLGRLQKYPIRERSLPHSRSCPQPGPLQGLGQRDECLCVSVAMCVLSSLCSVGGLLFLCIVTSLTVVETATPINSSQELCLWLYTFSFITNGNKLNGFKFPSTKLPCPLQPARYQAPPGARTVTMLPTSSIEVGFPSSSSRLVTVAAGNRMLNPMFSHKPILLPACIHIHVHACACVLGSTQCPSCAVCSHTPNGRPMG